MGHYKIADTDKAAKTPSEWLPVGAQIGELANEWAGRRDMVAYVGPGAGGPAPACYIPNTAEIEVNVNVAFGDMVRPRDIDLTTRSGRFEFPRATGAIFHEACHARFSQFDIPQVHRDLKKDEAAAFILLEESRIEAQGAAMFPRFLPFLKACAMEIVLGDMDEFFDDPTKGGTVTMAQLVGLVYARVDAGILDIMDVREVTDLLDDFFGLPRIARLREIAQKFQKHTDHANPVPVYPLAREWAEIVRETAEEKGETSPEGGEGEGGEGESSGEGSPGEGSGESSGEGGGEDEGGGRAAARKAMQDIMDAVRKALGEAADANEVGANEDLADAEWKERAEDVVAERKQKAEECKAAEAAFGNVFGGKDSGGGYGRSSSRLIETRMPTAQERRAAVVVAKQLEQAKYHDRVLTEVNDALPPGRLRSRAIVQAHAQRARGMMVNAEPWRRNVRKHVEDPNLTVGVLVDISGSMGSAMEPMATTAWVMSEAVRRVQGRSAMVYYGNSCFPTLRPGEHLDKVKVWSASDGTESFHMAFKALDGALNLLHGTGARLLFIVSDGEYTGDETAAAREWMKRCDEQGVAVVWLPFDRGDGATRITRKTQASVISGKKNPAEAAMLIGKACADALTKAGKAS